MGDIRVIRLVRGTSIERNSAECGFAHRPALWQKLRHESEGFLRGAEKA